MQVHIIGGGIIGLSTAWYLEQAGYEVTVIDATNLEDGTSHGNAGMIVPSHFVPLAAPGVIAQGMRWMLNSKSPFYVKPRLSMELAQWLWQFYRSCTPRNVAQAVPVLRAYNEWSKQLYQEFAQSPDFDFCFEKKGLLMLYRKSSTEHEEHEMAEQAAALGMEVEILDANAVKKLETGTEVEVLGGVFYPGDAHLYPNLFIHQLYRQLQAKGVKFLTGRTLQDFRTSKQGVSELILDDGQQINCQNVVLAAGSWTAKLARKIDVKILLQDGKGYSTTIEKPIERPSIPTILTEAKVAITPMGEDLRIGGTLEISNLSSRINQARLQGILESLPQYYPNLKVDFPKTESVWHGFRPCTPDGLPYMGYSQKYKNLFIATGHAMMGMSMGPASGKLVAQMMSGQATEIPVGLFDVERF
ncbi:MAG: FAD-dependent oxidoreductase [Saprospiraceae bacterium]